VEDREKNFKHIFFNMGHKRPTNGEYIAGDKFLTYFQFLKALLSSLFCVVYVWCGAITASGVGRSCSFMARLIAYDPRTLTKKGFFSGPVLDHAGRF
jgi:hypothetical protein